MVGCLKAALVRVLNCSWFDHLGSSGWLLFKIILLDTAWDLNHTSKPAWPLAEEPVSNLRQAVNALPETFGGRLAISQIRSITLGHRHHPKGPFGWGADPTRGKEARSSAHYSTDRLTRRRLES